MSSYLFADLEITDPATFATYREQVAPMIAHYGGRYLVRGGAVTVTEGAEDFPLHRVIILEFPDMAALRRFYDSPDYAPLMALRRAATVSRVALIEGYDPPA